MKKVLIALVLLVGMTSLAQEKQDLKEPNGTDDL
jgi:hypothetical protein